MDIGKARAEFALVALLLGVGIGLRLPAVGFLALPLAAHLLGGFLLAAADRPPRLQATRTVSVSRVWEGETVEVAVELENRGRRVELLHVRDLVPHGIQILDGRDEVVADLAPGATLSLTYTARVRRGVYELPSVQVQARDLLGYVGWSAVAPCPAQLTVLPRYERLGGVALSPRRTLPQAGAARSRRGGAGVEFFGAREYRPGDEIRRVNWKATARTGELVVTDYEEERAADVAVVLDVRAAANRGEKPLDLLDHSARGAATVARGLLAQGNRVGLLLYGAYLDWVYPGYGHRHGERLLRQLARARPGHSEVFAELRNIPTRLLAPGSQVVVVSPLLPGDEEDLGALVARGYRVLALVPDVTTMEREQLGTGPEVDLAARILALERWALVQRLYAARVRALLWDVRYPLAPQARAAWRRIW